MGISVGSFNYSVSLPKALVAGPHSALRAATAGAVRASPVTPNQPRDQVTFPSSDAQGWALLRAGSALDAPARISNTLATADGALASIGQLFTDVRSTLSVTQAHATATDQLAIDANLARVDALVRSTTFSGQPLLDGTFSTTLNGQTLSLPSFATSSLGNSSVGAPMALSDLRSEGDASLLTGSASSVQIVDAAIGQVSGTRRQIEAFREVAVQPLIKAGRSAVEQLLPTPMLSVSSSAGAVALLVRAQALLDLPSLQGGLSVSAARTLALLQ